MAIRKLIELIAPDTCLGCGRQGDLLCANCLAKLPAGRNVPPSGQLAGVTVATDYTGPVKELILSLKFKRSRSAAALAAWLLAGRLSLESARFDCVTAVPIAPARYRERGYNQAELIARALARQLGVPYRSLLGRTTTEHQMGRTRAERLAGIQGAFYATRRHLAGQRILVVDDVVTTGATLGECAHVLRGAGAKVVYGAAVARH
jgi:ComF family protein